MAELVVLAELMLRGPQTLGEIRGNASRMHPIESLESCQALLDALASRPTEASGIIPGPLVRELPPPPGSRAKLFAQLLSPDAHPVISAASVAIAPREPAVASSDILARLAALEARVAALESLSN
jgi:uncharacterized protein YceH (UPF0502 family)